MAKKIDLTKKEKILEATKSLIIKSGTNNFSLRDIAKKANISLGTLYYYYKSKDDLIIDLSSLYLKKLNKDYFEWLKRHEDGDLTSDRYLDVIFYKGVKLYDRGKIHLFLLNECLGGNKDLTEKYKELYKTWLDSLKLGIKQVFPKVKEPERFAMLLMMMLDGFSVQEVLKLKNNIDYKNLKNLLKEIMNG